MMNVLWFRRFVKDNLYYLYPFSALVAIGAFLAFFYTKDILLLAINSRYSSGADLFFKYYTHVGDGVTYLAVMAVFFLFVSKEKGLMLGLSYALSSIPVQILKNFVFQENFRPRAFFWQDFDRLHFVEGVEVLVSGSFPSGHSAAGFSLFLCLSHIFKNKPLSFLFFIMAFFVAYSRMYLAQHFFADVYAGSIIAVGMTSVVIYVLEDRLKLHQRPSLQRGLLSKA